MKRLALRLVPGGLLSGLARLDTLSSDLLGELLVPVYTSATPGAVPDLSLAVAQSIAARRAFAEQRQQFRRRQGEGDRSYRDRLCDLLPRGATHYAEDLGDASGKSLDALGDVLADWLVEDRP